MLKSRETQGWFKMFRQDSESTIRNWSISGRLMLYIHDGFAVKENSYWTYSSSSLS